jgi:class 3 adenylate cyclase
VVLVEDPVSLAGVAGLIGVVEVVWTASVRTVVATISLLYEVILDDVALDNGEAELLVGTEVTLALVTADVVGDADTAVLSTEVAVGAVAANVVEVAGS